MELPLLVDDDGERAGEEAGLSGLRLRCRCARARRGGKLGASLCETERRNRE